MRTRMQMNTRPPLERAILDLRQGGVVMIKDRRGQAGLVQAAEFLTKAHTSPRLWEAACQCYASPRDTARHLTEWVQQCHAIQLQLVR